MQSMNPHLSAAAISLRCCCDCSGGSGCVGSCTLSGGRRVGTAATDAAAIVDAAATAGAVGFSTAGGGCGARMALGCEGAGAAAGVTAAGRTLMTSPAGKMIPSITGFN